MGWAELPLLAWLSREGRSPHPWGLAGISNHIPSKVWDQIAYKFSNFNSFKLQWLQHWSLGMDKCSHLKLYNVCNFLSMMGLKLIHASKRSPCCVLYTIQWRSREWEILAALTRANWLYCQTSNIRLTLLDNKIVDHSDVVGASPVDAAPTTSSFST